MATIAAAQPQYQTVDLPDVQAAVDHAEQVLGSSLDELWAIEDRIIRALASIRDVQEPLRSRIELNRQRSERHRRKVRQLTQSSSNGNGNGHRPTRFVLAGDAGVLIRARRLA
jgi:hypothetical protein